MNFKNKFLFTFLLVFIFGGLLPSNYVLALTQYWFNNAVNTSPTTLGNYWLNSGATTPATTLPDLTVDKLTIIAAKTYAGSPTFNSNGRNNGTVTGDAIFKDTSANSSTGTVNGNASFYNSSFNNGTIVGNAIFYGDDTENNNTVNGTKTRYFTSDTQTGQDFVSDGPWTVVADGAVVDVSTAVYDGTTTFSAINGGSFVFIRYRTYVTGNTVKIVYGENPDSGSVPDESDFTATKNGESINVTNVTLNSATLTITLSSSIGASDVLKLTYTPGSFRIQDDFGNALSGFTDRRIFPIVATDAGPYYPFPFNNKLYVNNQTGNTVSVVDLTTHSVIASPSIGGSTYYTSGIGRKIYVSSFDDDNVSVIDTDSNTTIDTITVGDGPIYSIIAGNKLYVSNLTEGSVSVIDTDTDTVTATITVPGSASYFTIVGQKLYVALQDTGKVSVIDALTDSLITTITVGSSPYSLVTVGSKVYVGNGTSGTVSVINSVTDTVTATISVGGLNQNPVFLRAVGDKVYVDNLSGNTLSVIDANTDTVMTTLSLPFGPYASTYWNGKLYVGNQDASDLGAVIDTINDTLEEVLHVGDTASRQGIADGMVYFGSLNDSYMALIDSTTVESELPNLESFSSSATNGTYVAGDHILITANFGFDLDDDSSMTVRLNNGATVHLNDVAGSRISGDFHVTGNSNTPDLAIDDIISADVTDESGVYHKTSYNVPFSVGDFEGENSFITRNLGDAKNIQIGNYTTIDVGDNPYQLSGNINGYVYVANQGSDNVSVIQLSDNTVVATIPVGEEPYGLASADVGGTTFLYVANINTDNVSVINTSTNTVTATVSVGVKPYYVAAVGTKVYVTNGGSNTVSVINANNNTVIDTIPVGVYPRGIKAYGTDLYVANFGSQDYSGGNYISVIDSTTDTVTDTVVLPIGSEGPRGVNVLGDKVYVANFRSNNVSVIDTGSNTVVDTIHVGAGPRGLLGYNGQVYVENFDDGTISIIDANTGDVVRTMVVGNAPSGISLVGTNIYYTSFQDGLVRIIDTTTGELAQSSSDSGTSLYGNSTGGGGGGGISKKKDPVKETPTIVVPTPNQTPTTPLTPVKFEFKNNLKVGVVMNDVLELQKYLNDNGFTLTLSGPGSKGNETTKFGGLTKLSVMKFQKANGLVADGLVGPKTRAILNK